MKPGLVLSDDQCQKKFGPKKGTKDDRVTKPGSEGRSREETEEEVDDPGEETRAEQEEMADEDFSVLIDPVKSLSEQNRIGRQLFVSIFSTGSVSSGQLSDEELEMFQGRDDLLHERSHLLCAMLVYQMLKLLQSQEESHRHIVRHFAGLTLPMSAAMS